MTTSTTIKELCRYFHSHSTLHGLHYLFDSPWKLRRAIWLLLLLLATCNFGYQALEAYAKWRKHEVYLATTFESEKQLKFPSVTICNMNMLKKSKILGKEGQLYLDGQDQQYIKEWKKIRSKLKNTSFDIEKEILTNSHTARDVIKEIKFASVCPSTKNNVTTESIFDFSSGMCHTIVTRNTARLGAIYGLSLLLDAEPHEYYGPYSYDGTGFRLMVHDPDVYPLMDHHGIDIPTGFKTNIRVFKMKKIRLPAPYPTKCSEKKLRSSNVYSKSRCIMEQYSSETGRKCGCRLLGFPVVGQQSRRYCNIEEIWNCAILAYYRYNFTDGECPKRCTSISYHMQSSAIVYPSNSALESFKNEQILCDRNYNFMSEFNKSKKDGESYSEWFRGRYARVTVYFSSRDVQTVEEKPAFDSLDFAGNIGGNMGLYLGCSVLTLVEFIDLLVLVIIQWFNNRHSKKNMKVFQAWTQKQETTVKPDKTQGT